MDSQYTRFLWNALQGDLGISVKNVDRPVTEVVLHAFKVTAVLAVCAVLIASFAGISLGVLAAVHRNGLIDYLSMLLASAGSAVPSFVLGVFLIYVLAGQLHWLPTFGWDTRNGLIPGYLPKWQQMILPVLSLSFGPTTLLARVTRAAMLDVLTQDYIRTAHSKGLAAWVVFRRHALRNALIPVLTIIGPITAGLLTGAIIIETLFTIPGVGRLFVQSIEGRDYGLIMGTTLLGAAIFALANLIVDITYAIVDPRIRYA